MTDRAAVRDHLLDERRTWVTRTLECAAAVAETWEVSRVSDRDRVVEPFRAVLARSGVLGTAPAVLAECAGAVGQHLSAEPVGSPPYVVVTSEGLVMRATLEDARLVVRVAAFEVCRAPTLYVHAAATPEQAVVVEFLDSSS